MPYCRECGAYIPEEQEKCLACGWQPEIPFAARSQSQTQTQPEHDPERDRLREDFEELRRRQREQDLRWAREERRRREEERRRAAAESYDREEAWREQRLRQESSWGKVRYGGASIRSRSIALVLCALTGVLGVHYFYVGRVGMGLLYLFTGGLFGVGWIVDIIKIALGSFRDNTGAPLLFWG